MWPLLLAILFFVLVAKYLFKSPQPVPKNTRTTDKKNDAEKTGNNGRYGVQEALVDLAKIRKNEAPKYSKLVIWRLKDQAESAILEQMAKVLPQSELLCIRGE